MAFKKILKYDFSVKYIPGLLNTMPDYLSRFPVDDAEEDPDEASRVTSQSIQTDLESSSQHLSVVAAVQTRSAELRHKTSTTSSTPINIIANSSTSFFNSSCLRYFSYRESNFSIFHRRLTRSSTSRYLCPKDYSKYPQSSQIFSQR